MRRSLAALVALASLVLAAPAAAQFPARIDLPNGSQPEGISAGEGNLLYVGSIATGAVRRIGARTGRSRTSWRRGTVARRSA